MAHQLEPAYFGKYRGTVANPMDPLGMGRIQVLVPDVLGSNSMAWAMPCTPYGGAGLGWFAVPAEGAKVWVEFERGDPDYPIWSGCFWGQGESPAGLDPTAVLKRILKTDTVELSIDDNPALPGLSLTARVGGIAGEVNVEIGMAGLKIACAGNTLEMGADGVSINGTNLKVLK